MPSTLNRTVEWERCAERATPAERRALDALRSLAGLFARSDAGRHTSSTGREDPVRGDAGSLARLAVLALMSVAAAEVALAGLLLPWHWNDYYRAHGDLAVYMTLLLVGHGASAGLLLFAGRRDRRTWLLGGFFLFKATVALPHMLPAFWGQMPPVDALEMSFREVSAPTRAFLLLHAFPLAYAVAPAFLWAFARECPSGPSQRSPRRSRAPHGSGQRGHRVRHVRHRGQRCTGPWRSTTRSTSGCSTRPSPPRTCCRWRRW